MTAAELPKMSYAIKAVLQSHPSNRSRATARFILECFTAAQDLHRMQTILDDPSFIVDGPETAQAIEYLFQQINARFFQHFGEEVPK